MTVRSFLLGSALVAGLGSGFGGGAAAQDFDGTPATPVLRATVAVTGDLVRIGDLVENAGSSGQIAVFRAPDLGMTGTVSVAQVVQALRAHQVIGIDTRDLREIAVTHTARTLTSGDVESQIAKTLAGRNGLGEAANIAVVLDRVTGSLQLEASNRGDLNPIAARFDQRTGRFDITFEIANDTTSPTRLRYTGQAYETVETAVLARSLDRGELLKASDITVERRPKAEAGADIAKLDRATGMQLRKAVRVGQVLRNSDFGRPDLVQRDQTVSIVYEAPGLYLTMRGKANDSGAEGDTVSVVNLASKRVVQGVVSGPGQVAIAPVAPRVTASLVNPSAGTRADSSE